MDKKYLVLITKNPYGRDDGFQTHPATSEILNNKLFETKEEAESAVNEIRQETAFDELKKQMFIDADLFFEIQKFIIEHQSIDINGTTIKSDYSVDKLITIFIKMFALDIEYDEIKYNHDKDIVVRMFGDEPIINIVEVTC